MHPDNLKECRCGDVMNYVERRFSEIRMIDNEGITFNDGEMIVFKDCIGRKYNSKTCVAERDICAMPPYFEFFTPDRQSAEGIPVRIVFDKKGLFSKSVNRKNFLEFQMKINKAGYLTYDLS